MPEEPNPFQEKLDQIIAQQSQAGQATTQLANALAALNQRTSWLPTPAAQAPPEPPSIFTDPDAGIEARFDSYFAKKVAPALNNAMQGSYMANRHLAREAAKSDPSVADVFKHFGPQVEEVMQKKIAAGAHVNPEYWIDAAKIVKADRGEELAKLKLTAQNVNLEGGGSGGGQPAVNDAAELPSEHAEMARRAGYDPKNPKIIEFYNAQQKLRRSA